ncbi:HRDC domain-containing protein [Corynebacterium sp. HMSC067D03]|uniref:HRDC domain-containing protein n=1 Tax=Corynebacterium sp. HMSC067D03 TaxID=1739289 RepID=UPI0008A28B72|nr:HRDC domain-containing protein [Corynebacterium sp. HMSC067D03]
MTSQVQYHLVETPEQFSRAAAALAEGRGAYAIDTERAASFRYDDRAFLVQIYRRDTDTYLFAPEGNRDALHDALAPVINGEDWIIHAAVDDLKSLAMLGLYPGTIFDTELASRFAGFNRPNLAAMVQHFVGVELKKGHGHEDWSTTPLPPTWQEYAALDVAHLHDLAEALAEQLDNEGKLSFAEQEFERIVNELGPDNAPFNETWRDMKGVSGLRSARSLQLAKTLWTARDEHCRKEDISPGHMLSSESIVTIARTVPSSPWELRNCLRYRSLNTTKTKFWFSLVEQALAEDPEQWPTPAQPAPTDPPAKIVWEHDYPRSWHALQSARKYVSEVAAQQNIRPDMLLSSAVLRQVMWTAPDSDAVWSTDAAAMQLKRAGARPWQIALTAPLLARAQAEAKAAGIPQGKTPSSGRAAARRRRRKRAQ